MHGLSLIIAFNLGVFIYFVPWLIPFALALVFFVCYLVTEVFYVPNPKYFYILLLFTIGLKGIGKVEFNNLFSLNVYLLYGIAFSIISTFLISILYNIPWRNQNKCKYRHLSMEVLVDKV